MSAANTYIFCTFSQKSTNESDITAMHARSSPCCASAAAAGRPAPGIACTSTQSCSCWCARSAPPRTARPRCTACPGPSPTLQTPHVSTMACTIIQYSISTVHGLMRIVYLHDLRHAWVLLPLCKHKGHTMGRLPRFTGPFPACPWCSQRGRRTRICRTLLSSTVLYCTVLCCTVLYCTVLYCVTHPEEPTTLRLRCPSSQ